MRKLFNKLISPFGLELKEINPKPTYSRCHICKGQYVELPYVNSNRYVFKREFELTEEIKIEGEEFRAYGWIIEMTYKWNEKTNWVTK